MTVKMILTNFVVVSSVGIKRVVCIEIRPRGYKTFFSCSTQLSMNFSLLIILLAEKCSCSTMKKIAIVSNLRFISRTNFMLNEDLL